MGKHGDVHRRFDGTLTLFENNDGMPFLVDVNCTYVYGPHNVLQPQTIIFHMVKQNQKEKSIMRYIFYRWSQQCTMNTTFHKLYK